MKPFTLFRWIALAILLVPWLQATDLPALQSLKLSVEGRSSRIQDKRVEAGSLKLVLEDGSASRLLDRGKAAGIYFRGRGHFEYQSRERMEAAAMAYNLERNLNIVPVKSGDSTFFKEDFSELVLYAADKSSLVAEAPGGDDQGPAFGAMLKPPMGSVLADMEQLAALHESNTAGTPLRFALLKGSHGHYLHVQDSAETLTESLSALRKSPLPGDLVDHVPISVRPLGWDWKAPVAPPATLTHVALKVEASRGLGVKVEAKETFRANQDGVRALLLELYNQKWDFNLGSPVARPYKVLRVKGPAGADLAFDHRNDSLVVILPTVLRAGATATLEFQIEGDLLIHPGGDNYWTLGVEPWFPQPPSLAGQDYTVEAEIRVPKPFVPMAPGATLFRREEGELNALAVKIDKPIQFFVVQGGKYRIVEEKKDGLTIRVAAYANEAAEPLRLARLSRQIIAFYQRFLGPFPFPEFNIIQMHEWGYGQAPPGTMFITNEAFRRIEDSTLAFDSAGLAIDGPSLDRILSKGVNGRFAHEIAHQYWGHVVKMPSHEEQWITESFSEICAGLAVKQMKSLGESYFQSMTTNWKNRAEMATAASSIAAANRLRTDGIGRGQEASLKRQGLIYDKGAYLLDRIRRDVGDKVFMAFLGNYQASFAWKFGTTQHVVGLLKHMTQRDYTDLFERCYWGAEMPPEKLTAK